MRGVDTEELLLGTLQSRPVLRKTCQIDGPLSLWCIDRHY